MDVQTGRIIHNDVSRKSTNDSGQRPTDLCLPPFLLNLKDRGLDLDRHIRPPPSFKGVFGRSFALRSIWRFDRQAIVSRDHPFKIVRVREVGYLGVYLQSDGLERRAESVEDGVYIILRFSIVLVPDEEFELDSEGER